ncbi:MAG: aspartate aminotransferase family protein [Alphaproteobacteria bacterium]|nr:aspartate aminotransferase family protein [Alphaproteobacteria bacterium]
MTNAVMPTYARADVAFERGEGPYIFDTNGRRYLDFGAGIAVNVLGHAHPTLVKALNAAGSKLWHTSNLYRIPAQENLAATLTAHSFADMAFFGNSGAEANEGAIKVVRKYQSANGRPERYRIITFEGAFHGRTLATLAAGRQQKHLAGFGPVVDGFDQVPYGDLAAAKAAITRETAGFLVEPIQGESGIRVPPPGFLKGLRALADEHDLLLAFDEVQTGLGRTGKLFGYEYDGVKPDVMALAKALGGGFPIGAVLATMKAGVGMTAGTHGSTFGGNPLAAAVANAVMSEILAPGFIERAAKVGERLKSGLDDLMRKHGNKLTEVRGRGLMLGLKVQGDMGKLIDVLRGNGLLVVSAGDNVIRLLPPLIIDEAHVSEGLGILDRSLRDFTP